MITRRFLFPLRSGQVAETVRTLDALKTQALAALEQKTDLNQLDPAVDALPAPLRPVLAPVFAPVLTQSLQPLPAGRPANAGAAAALLADVDLARPCSPLRRSAS